MADIDTHALERETGFGWGWFTVLGAMLIALGALAFLNLPPEGTASVYAVGVFMLIGAFVQLGTTLLVPRWRGIGLLVLSAISYGAAGVLAIVNPMLAAMPLTVLLASALAFSGIIRIRLTSVMPSLPGWGWVAASGFVSLVCGLAFVHLLYSHKVWLLGVALTADLTFQGATALAFGLALKANARAISSSPMEP
jgi:uncharacterized membrane protein HdeD (DUF308 family)